MSRRARTSESLQMDLGNCRDNAGGERSSTPCPPILSSPNLLPRSLPHCNTCALTSSLVPLLPITVTHTHTHRSMHAHRYQCHRHLPHTQNTLTHTFLAFPAACAPGLAAVIAVVTGIQLAVSLSPGSSAFERESEREVGRKQGKYMEKAE